MKVGGQGGSELRVKYMYMGFHTGYVSEGHYLTSCECLIALI